MNAAFVFLAWLSLVCAETHTWYFQTTWVDANPDGFFERKVIGFNNTWPLPILRVKKGDRINLYLNNGFDDRNTTLHFHGMFQNGTTQMDGPEMVTQCPIAPGDTFLYNFTVDQQVGTYWYHLHTSGQYGDGMRAAFIIEEPTKEDYPFDFDEEVVLTVAEWYHDTADTLIPQFLNLYNPQGTEPIPQTSLFNDTRGLNWTVEPNKTYFVRIVNVGGFVSQWLFMEDHEFEVVEVDGVYVNKTTTPVIYITIAQRYGVLIRTKNDTSRNFAFMNNIDDSMLDTPKECWTINSTNSIQYNKDAAFPDPIDKYADQLDDIELTTLAQVPLLPDSDQQITIAVQMNNLGNGINYAFFNNLTYTVPKVPVLATALSSGEFATNSYIYGNTNAFVIQNDDVIDIILNNEDTGRHPFHLHGHVFQLLARGEEVDDNDPPVAFDPHNHTDYPDFPMMRDTVYVEPQLYIVMRFRADNPGVWFFHCHIEWHLEQGLAIVLIEDPETMQKTPSQQFTENHKAVCSRVGVNITGNAAGNTVDYMDLLGANVQYKPLPSGFTARGIVALVFSCVAAFVGMAAIAFYGMSEVADIEERVVRDLNVNIDPEEIEEDLMVDEIMLHRDEERLSLTGRGSVERHELSSIHKSSA